MASSIAGLFANPADIRNSRIDELMKQRQAVGQMGGSMSQLLGQVAAGGGATGAMMAEGLGGMFGMKTAEEAKAAQIQDMASQLDLSTPQGLKLFARMLNNQGMTEEAMKVFELASAKETQALDSKVKEANLNDRPPKLLGQRYNEDSMTLENVYGYYDPSIGDYVEISVNGKQSTPTPDGDPTIKGGSAADYVKKKGWAN